MNAESVKERLANVAIITRTKDRTILLQRAIFSVLSQTYADWHHIIVNDGGQPAAVDQLVAHYSGRYKGRVTVLHNGQSLGMEAASNMGIRSSSSEHLVIHDDDDSWEPRFLERCLEEFEKCRFGSVRGVVTHTNEILERIDGHQLFEVRRQDMTPDLVAVSLPQISELNRFMPIAFLFKRSVIDDIGMFDETLPVIGDWEFNIRFFMKYDVIVIPERLANYHVRPDSSGELGNTVTNNRAKHEFYRTLIINKHMRLDMARGILTQGLILALGDYFHRMSGGVSRIGNVLDRIKSHRFVVWLRELIKI